MTASASLALHAHSMEYVLCIEGVGWLRVEGSGPGSGFVGHVFATADLNGDLESILEIGGGAVTLHKGLRLPASISETMDQTTLAYQVNGMSFEIVDHDGWILANMTPHRTLTQDTLAAELDIMSTTVETTDGTFAEGDVVWLGGREAVKLGAKAGATYTGCTRSYLGTPNGRVVSSLLECVGMSWNGSTPHKASDTVVDGHCRFMRDRRVKLYAHVPGEAASGMMLLFSGRLRGMTSDRGGTAFKFQTAGESCPAETREIEAAGGWATDLLWFVNRDGTRYSVTGQPVSGSGSESNDVVYEIGAGQVAAAGPRLLVRLRHADDAEDRPNALALGAFYHYRSEPGGTAGMVANIDSTTPQAATVGDDEYLIDAYAMVDGKLLHVEKKSPSHFYENAICSVVDQYTDLWLSGHQYELSTRFLLDNVSDDWRRSRFAVNKQVGRHPIDVLLTFMTTMPGEFYIGDAQAGSTYTRVIFPDSTLGAEKQFNGYALHCVEGDNKGESRIITYTAASGVGNYIDVEPAFTNAPTAGDEYQVRNTIYDVLPLPWGMGVHNSRIDVDAFEQVRERYLPGATVSKFIIGDSDRLDLWELLQTNICAPYMLLLYTDRSTGKLSCRFIGDDLGSDVLGSTEYTTVSKESVLDVGEIKYGLQAPVDAIEVEVRADTDHLISIRSTGRTVGFGPYARDYSRGATGLLNTETTTLRVVSPELARLYPASGLSTLGISALFNGVSDSTLVLALAAMRLKRLLLPPPTVPMTLSMDKIDGVQAGSLLVITNDAAVDPYNAAVGISGITARVLEAAIQLRERNPGIDLKLELLPTLAAGKIAPAGDVYDKGSDGNGEYVRIRVDSYVSNYPDDQDHYHFVVGDYVELRDLHGAVKEQLGTITGFGTNFVSDPEEATVSVNVCNVYVSDASIASTIDAGDYITFRDWRVGNTVRMQTYSYYADAAGTLGPLGIDPAKVYA